MLPRACDLLAIAAAIDDSGGGGAPISLTGIAYSLIYSAIGGAVAVVGSWSILRGKAIEAGAAKATLDAAADSEERKNLQKIIEARDQAIARYEQRFESINTKLETQAGAIGSLQAKVENLETRDREQSKRIGALTAEVTTLTKKLFDVQGELSEEKHAHEKTREHLAAERAENATNTTLSERMSDRLKAAEASATTLTVERDEIARRLKAAEDALSLARAR